MGILACVRALAARHKPAQQDDQMRLLQALSDPNARLCGCQVWAADLNADQHVDTDPDGQS